MLPVFKVVRHTPGIPERGREYRLYRGWFEKPEALAGVFEYVPDTTKSKADTVLRYPKDVFRKAVPQPISKIGKKERTVAYKRERISCFGSRSYIEISDGTDIYRGYPVGLGRRGLYLCIYKGDMPYMLVEKELYDRSSGDSCYTLYGEDFEIGWHYAIVWDWLAFGRYRAGRYNGYSSFGAQRSLFYEFERPFEIMYLGLSDKH